MRILFLTRKWPPAVGGMETYSFELVAELRALGHDVDLHALPGSANGSAPSGLRILFFGMRKAVELLTGFGGRGGWQAIQGGDMAIWPLVALARLRARHAAVVLAAHGTDVGYAERPGLGGWLYRHYLRLGAKVLTEALVAANSQATAERVRMAGFATVHVIPLACRPPIPCSAFLPDGLKSGQFLLFAGRLVRRKGLAWFVREVLPALPSGTVLAVAGTVWDRSEAAALRDPRVRWLGSLGQERLAALMAEAACVVVPNIPAGPGHFEGFGLVAVEAAAAGAIVLAPRLDGFTDSVIEGETGQLLPPGDAPAWIAALETVLGRSPAERASAAERTRRTAGTRFTWTRVARETAALHDAPP